MDRKFDHTLTTRDIVIRQDDIYNEKTLTGNAGRLFPLIMIGDVVIHYSNISHFKINIGGSFLPTIDVTIEDEDYGFREQDFSDGVDTATVFIGIPNDEEYVPIKNEYLILSSDSSTEGNKLSFSLELHIPSLYDNFSQSLEGSSLDMFEQYARDLSLGLTTNISSTNDSQVWVQRSDKTYKENIMLLRDRCYISDNDRIEVFVDAYACLNIISLYNTTTGGTIEELLIDPQTGEPLAPTFPLEFTNNVYSESPVRIDRWTPISGYSDESKCLNTTFSVTNVNENTETVNEVSIDNNNEQISTGGVYTANDNGNTHPNYGRTSALQKENYSLRQGVRIKAKLQHPIPAIYMYMYTNVNLYTYPKRTDINNNDRNIIMTDMESQTPEAESFKVALNEKMSGAMFVDSIEYIFNKRNGMKENIIFNKI